MPVRTSSRRRSRPTARRSGAGDDVDHADDERLGRRDDDLATTRSRCSTRRAIRSSASSTPTRPVASSTSRRRAGWRAFTVYSFQTTDGLRGLDGVPFAELTSAFETNDNGVAASPTSFNRVTFDTIQGPTVIQEGPDGRLVRRERDRRDPALRPRPDDRAAGGAAARHRHVPLPVDDPRPRVLGEHLVARRLGVARRAR